MVAHRTLATSAARPADAIIFSGDQDKSEIYPRIGDRDIVGWGINGKPDYIDHVQFPCPAIRWKENTADVVALRAKEVGDWKAMTIDEKKALYRASFRSTYPEIYTPTGKWKLSLIGVLWCVTAALGCQLFFREFVFGQDQLPFTLKEDTVHEWNEAALERMVRTQAGHLTGPASMFDYEKSEWKK